MNQAVKTNLGHVNQHGCCPEGDYKSVWDRLCEKLFGIMPKGMDAETVLPDIWIWKDGVSLQEETDGTYTFWVTSPDGTSPSPGDVIEYKGKFYIIGTVH